MRGIKQFLLAACVVGMAAASASGQVFTFVGTVGGQPVDVKAAFSVSATNTLTVVLTNLQANPTSVIQNISDLSFDVFNAAGVQVPRSDGTLSSSSGLERTVNTDKSFTDGSTVSTGWVLDTDQGSTFHLNVLGTAIGPKHTIIGPSGPGNVYSNAGGSIAGNTAHNPFLTGPVEFDVNLPGVTSDWAIRNVVFSFGTTPGGGSGGGNVPTPNAALLMSVGGVAGWFGIFRRRKA